MTAKHGITIGGVIVTLVVVCAVTAGILAIWKANITGEKTYEDDLARYRKIDPKLIIYRELQGAAFSTGFAEARGIAVDGRGRIYVAGDKAIRTFENGEKVAEIPLSQPPRALTVGKDEWIYAAMKDHVEAIGPDGSVMKLPSAGEKAVLTSVAVSGADVYAADAGNRIVHHYYKLDRHGTIGKKDQAEGIDGFIIPSAYFDVATDDKGMLHAANTGRHRIETYTRQGKLAAKWPSQLSNEIEGFCGCCNPVNFAITPEGNFVTAEKGLTRVKLHNEDGIFLGVVAGPESFAQHDSICASKGSEGCNIGGLDVAVDAAGRVLVLDPFTAQVRIFVRKDQPSAKSGK